MLREISDRVFRTGKQVEAQLCGLHSRRRSEWPAWTLWRASWRQARSTGCASTSAAPGAGWSQRWLSGAGPSNRASRSLVSATATSDRTITWASSRRSGPARPTCCSWVWPSPFKETWCERHRQPLEVPVIMGVGGSFDVLAGFIKRAPRWAQRLGLEWLASDGAPQAVETLFHHQQRVHLARRPRNYRPPPGATAGHTEP